MYTQGIDPLLDFSDIELVRSSYERCTRMDVPPRHPYAGELVFTAFSGSHQDAISKGMTHQATSDSALWDVPYLPIDPKDIGRTYEAIIRINAQSGKGGVAYVMESEYGYQIPKAMRVAFGHTINVLADELGNELNSLQIRKAFEETYLNNASPFKLESFRSDKVAGAPPDKAIRCVAQVSVDGVTQAVSGAGNGPVNAFVAAMREELVPDFRFISYSEHSLQRGSAAEAVAYIEIRTPSGEHFFGAGIDQNIEIAPIKGMLSALNRALAKG